MATEATETAPIQKMRTEARQFHSTLRKRIEIRQAEIVRLRREERAVQTFLRQTGGGSVVTISERQRRDWRPFLDQLPKTFKAKNLADIPELKGLRSSEVYAAISRWLESGFIRRKSKGVYLKKFI